MTDKSKSSPPPDDAKSKRGRDDEEAATGAELAPEGLSRMQRRFPQGGPREALRGAWEARQRAAAKPTPTAPLAAVTLPPGRSQPPPNPPRK